VFDDELSRNARAGRPVPETRSALEARLAGMSAATRTLFAVRQLLVAGAAPAEVDGVLDALGYGADDAERAEALLLRGCLARDRGDDDAAGAHERAAFAALGAPVPAPSVQARGGVGLPGLGAALSGPGLFLVDDLLGAPGCAAAARELDALAAAGRLRSGGFYDSAAGTATAGRCDKRRAELADFAGCKDVAVGALHAIARAFSRLVLANNHYEGTAYYPLEVQLAHYAGDGARYEVHTDRVPGARLERRATLLYYPNPGWTAADGGLLRVETAAGWEELEPLPDRLIAFASGRRHEVTPCHAPRRSVTGWCWSVRA